MIKTRPAFVHVKVDPLVGWRVTCDACAAAYQTDGRLRFWQPPRRTTVQLVEHWRALSVAHVHAATCISHIDQETTT